MPKLLLLAWMLLLTGGLQEAHGKSYPSPLVKLAPCFCVGARVQWLDGSQGVVDALPEWTENEQRGAWYYPVTLDGFGGLWILPESRLRLIDEAPRYLEP